MVKRPGRLASQRNSRKSPTKKAADSKKRIAKANVLSKRKSANPIIKKNSPPKKPAKKLSHNRVCKPPFLIEFSRRSFKNHEKSQSKLVKKEEKPLMKVDLHKKIEPHDQMTPIVKRGRKQKILKIKQNKMSHLKLKRESHSQVIDAEEIINSFSKKDIEKIGLEKVEEASKHQPPKGIPKKVKKTQAKPGKINQQIQKKLEGNREKKFREEQRKETLRIPTKKEEENQPHQKKKSPERKETEQNFIEQQKAIRDKLEKEFAEKREAGRLKEDKSFKETQKAQLIELHESRIIKDMNGGFEEIRKSLVDHKANFNKRLGTLETTFRNELKAADSHRENSFNSLKELLQKHFDEVKKKIYKKEKLSSYSKSSESSLKVKKRTRLDKEEKLEAQHDNKPIGRQQGRAIRNKNPSVEEKYEDIMKSQVEKPEPKNNTNADQKPFERIFKDKLHSRNQKIEKRPGLGNLTEPFGFETIDVVESKAIESKEVPEPKHHAEPEPKEKAQDKDIKAQDPSPMKKNKNKNNLKEVVVKPIEKEQTPKDLHKDQFKDQKLAEQHKDQKPIDQTKDIHKEKEPADKPEDLKPKEVKHPEQKEKETPIIQKTQDKPKEENKHAKNEVQSKEVKTLEFRDRELPQGVKNLEKPKEDSKDNKPKKEQPTKEPPKEIKQSEKHSSPDNKKPPDLKKDDQPFDFFGEAKKHGPAAEPKPPAAVVQTQKENPSKPSIATTQPIIENPVKVPTTPSQPIKETPIKPPTISAQNLKEDHSKPPAPVVTPPKDNPVISPVNVVQQPKEAPVKPPTVVQPAKETPVKPLTVVQPPKEAPVKPPAVVQPVKETPVKQTIVAQAPKEIPAKPLTVVHPPKEVPAKPPVAVHQTKEDPNYFKESLTLKKPAPPVNEIPKAMPPVEKELEFAEPVKTADKQVNHPSVQNAQPSPTPVHPAVNSPLVPTNPTGSVQNPFAIPQLAPQNPLTQHLTTLAVPPPAKPQSLEPGLNVKSFFERSPAPADKKNETDQKQQGEKKNDIFGFNF